MTMSCLEKKEEDPKERLVLTDSKYALWPIASQVILKGAQTVVQMHGASQTSFPICHWQESSDLPPQDIHKA